MLSESGDELASGPNHELMSALQHLTTNRYPILPCENSARLFSYQGHVYFEGQPAQPPTNSWNEYHYVTRIENGQVQDVCGITFRDHVDVLEKSAATNDHEQATQAAGSAAASLTAPPVFGVEFRINTNPIGPLDAAGVSVFSVASGSVAELAGIEPGDVILKYNGVMIHSIVDARDLVRRTDHGETVIITLWHQNVEKTVEAHF